MNIIQDHPGKNIEEKSINAKGWFDSLKISQSKYIGKNQDEVIRKIDEKVKNLTISNKIKGIIAMEYDQ